MRACARACMFARVSACAWRAGASKNGKQEEEERDLVQDRAVVLPIAVLGEVQRHDVSQRQGFPGHRVPLELRRPQQPSKF